MLEDECCRLCSSNKNLISMFGGKSKSRRSFLRKMVFDILQIEIQPFDSASSICVNCCMDVSNFFHFKWNCFKTQEYLKTKHSNNHKNKKIRLECTNVKDLQVPTTEETKSIIKWLTDKQVENIPQTCKDFQERETQTERIICIVPNQLPRKTARAYTQTDKVNMRNSSVQCKIEKRRVDQLTQTSFVGEKSDKNVVVACDKSQSKRGRPKLMIKTKSTQTNNTTTALNERNTPRCENCSQTETSEYQNLGTQTEDDVKNNICQFTQTDSLQLISCPTGTNEKCKKTHQSILESPSKNCFRPIEAKVDEKKSDIDETKNMCEKIIPADTSPKNGDILSPRSSGLLDVHNAKDVKICKLCDKALYNTIQYKMHKKLHMQCTFCRKKFQSIKSKLEHHKTCEIKKCIDSSPYVEIERITV